MGHVDKVLSYKHTGDKTHYYNDFFTIELCENFHLHWRNMRLQFSKEEFTILAKAMNDAYFKWQILRKPYPYPETIYLSPAWKNLPDEQFLKNEIKIEQQVQDPNLPEIHVHYKNLRIDLNKEELKELKQLLEEVKI